MSAGGLVLTLLSAALLLWVRNEVAYRVQMAALDRIKALSDLDLGAAHEGLVIFKERSYYGILFDLSIWTARQAYPRLYERK